MRDTDRMSARLRLSDLGQMALVSVLARPRYRTELPQTDVVTS